MVLAWLKRPPCFRMHFTPTSSSWLSVVERWFRDLTQHRLRRGVFRSVDQLVQAIREYVEHHNADPKSLLWTRKAEDILAKVARSRAALDEIPSA